MSRIFRSLRARITAVTVLVAILAVVVTGLVSLQLVRQSTIDSAKSTLATKAQLASRLPVGTTLEQLQQRFSADADGTEVGVITRAGIARGPAAAYLTPRNVRTILSTDRLSLTRRAAGGSELVEARKTARGGAIVLAVPLDTVEAQVGKTERRIALALVIGTVVAIIAGALLARWLSRPLVVTALTTSEGRQREFLLSISHELRTPITAIRGYAEALADGMIRPEQLGAVGATLVGETERLDHFVADLLELARLEADDFSITRAPVPLRDLLDQIAEAWSARATRIGVRIETDAPAQLAVMSDGRRIRQVLDGLVENALRVAPATSVISLRARTDSGRTLIEVNDTGPGLDAAAQAIAFDRGALRDRYRDIRPVGTGLGLSIAARLTARLGASIAVASSPAGTTFTVAFPASAFDPTSR